MELCTCILDEIKLYYTFDELKKFWDFNFELKIPQSIWLTLKNENVECFMTQVADVLSWAHGLWFDELYYVWIVTDLINTLQGVFIFIVIGCQPQVSSLKCNIYFNNTNTWIIFRFVMYSNNSGDQRIISSVKGMLKTVNVILARLKLLHH